MPTNTKWSSNLDLLEHYRADLIRTREYMQWALAERAEWEQDKQAYRLKRHEREGNLISTNLNLIQQGVLGTLFQGVDHLDLATSVKVIRLLGLPEDTPIKETIDTFLSRGVV